MLDGVVGQLSSSHVCPLKETSGCCRSTPAYIVFAFSSTSTAIVINSERRHIIFFTASDSVRHLQLNCATHRIVVSLDQSLPLARTAVETGVTRCIVSQHSSSDMCQRARGERHSQSKLRRHKVATCEVSERLQTSLTAYPTLRINMTFGSQPMEVSVEPCRIVGNDGEFLVLWQEIVDCHTRSMVNGIDSLQDPAVRFVYEPHRSWDNTSHELIPSMGFVQVIWSFGGLAKFAQRDIFECPSPNRVRCAEVTSTPDSVMSVRTHGTVDVTTWIGGEVSVAFAAMPTIWFVERVQVGEISHYFVDSRLDRVTVHLLQELNEHTLDNSIILVDDENEIKVRQMLDSFAGDMLIDKKLMLVIVFVFFVLFSNNLQDMTTFGRYLLRMCPQMIKPCTESWLISLCRKSSP